MPKEEKENGSDDEEISSGSSMFSIEDFEDANKSKITQA